MLTKLRLSGLVPLLLVAVACSSDGGVDNTPGGSSTGGTPAASGGSGTAPVGGSGGTGTSVPLAGSGQAIGDGDQGQPFGPTDLVMIMPPAMGGMATGGSGGGSSIPGDGQMMTGTLRRGMSGTADFSQTGEDVTVVFNITGGCSDGPHNIVIYDGYACDGTHTEGKPWGERGTGFGPITCSNNKGTLTYTRSGADKTKNWTVADHVADTDVTARVLLFESDGDYRHGCMNFF